MATRNTRPIGVQILTEDGAVLALDVNRSEALTLSGKLTEHPIEGGGVVADHYSNDADTLSLDVLQTTEPRLAPEDAGRPLSTLERLDALKRSGAPLTVVTGLKSYTQMVIERISITRTSSTGDALSASVEFKRAVFASAAQVLVPEALRSARNRGMAEAQEIGLADSDEVGTVAGAAAGTATARDRTASSAGADSSTRNAAGDARATPEQAATERKETGSILSGIF